MTSQAGMGDQVMLRPFAAMGDGIADSEPPRGVNAACDLVEMQESSASSHAGHLDRAGPRTLVRHSRLSRHFLPSLRRPSRPATTPRFGVGIHAATFRVNVRWVTPLGEDTASMS